MFWQGRKEMETEITKTIIIKAIIITLIVIQLKYAECMIHDTFALHSMNDAQWVLEQQLLAIFSPNLYTEHDTIWYGIFLRPLGVNCPGCLLQLLCPTCLLDGGVVWEAEKCLIYNEHCSARTKLNHENVINIILLLDLKQHCTSY